MHQRTRDVGDGGKLIRTAHHEIQIKFRLMYSRNQPVTHNFSCKLLPTLKTETSSFNFPFLSQLNLSTINLYLAKS